MSSWIKEALAEAGISYRAFAEYLHPAYPKASAPAIAAACNPADTGVTFIGTVSKMAAVLTGRMKPRVERRRCPVRIQARLSNADAAAFNRARKVFGHRTVNDALIYALRWYINQGKIRAAEAAATDPDGTENEPTPSITTREEKINDESH